MRCQNQFQIAENVAVMSVGLRNLFTVGKFPKIADTVISFVGEGHLKKKFYFFMAMRSEKIGLHSLPMLARDIRQFRNFLTVFFFGLRFNPVKCM